eukprot:CAMPEP_0181227796 /NCGR_PEP_ID=MMETSP1096-20121128/32986_1 /TAXON_ID=156174 ORGANISM="Chrysochromulina ericina, Strain CCMP281" /NCGR_SAMPLE_ID=MMETSP1096 /ASSEMBLY_ACC=CAM_ASM_000453 /LENGTH=67 /DNA_ID=CAMNT_0023321239 /DNA_START=894 /DNA_END=1094 /DNA_ORIENTATION=+
MAYVLRHRQDQETTLSGSTFMVSWPRTRVGRTVASRQYAYRPYPISAICTGTVLLRVGRSSSTVTCQ